MKSILVLIIVTGFFHSAAAQQLASEKPWPKPAVPSTIKVAPARSKTKAAPAKAASEKPLDMEKIKRQRRRPH